MEVKIYGASDDLIEVEGDLEDEIDCYGRSPKLYVYANKLLQFCVKTSYKHGFWEIYPILDEKTFNGDEHNLMSKEWDIKVEIQGNLKHNRNSMVLNINSKGQDFIITKKRLKNV